MNVSQTMNRFENLEFDEAPHTKPGESGSFPKPTGTPVRDAGYFMAEADEAYRRGDCESALRFYSKALEDNHTVFPSWFGQVRMLLELGEFKEANIWSDRALELFPEHPDLLAAKAIAHLRMGLLDQALALSDNASSKKSASPFCWIARGEVLLNRKSKMADHCLTQAISACANPTTKARLAVELSKLLRRYGRLSEALDYASKAVQVLPTDAYAWVELGNCQSKLGMKEALLSFNEALKINSYLSSAQQGIEEYRGRGFLRRFRNMFRKRARP